MSSVLVVGVCVPSALSLFNPNVFDTERLKYSPNLAKSPSPAVPVDERISTVFWVTLLYELCTDEVVGDFCGALVDVLVVIVVGKLLRVFGEGFVVVSFFNSFLGDGGVAVELEFVAATPIVVERGLDDLRTGDTLPLEGDALRAGDTRERVDFVAGAGIWLGADATTTSSFRLGARREVLLSILN